MPDDPRTAALRLCREALDDTLTTLEAYGDDPMHAIRRIEIGTLKAALAAARAALGEKE